MRITDFRDETPVSLPGLGTVAGDIGIGFVVDGFKGVPLSGTPADGQGWVYDAATGTFKPVTILAVTLSGVQDGDGIYRDAEAGTWVNRPAARHAHIVGEPFVGDGAQTVFYLANEAQEDTVAAYDANGARVAVTQDPAEPDKITFAVPPAAGAGFIDYIPATG